MKAEGSLVIQKQDESQKLQLKNIQPPQTSVSAVPVCEFGA